MSVSGISSSSSFNTPNANVQNQQQWQQEFQKLAQELQSGSLASPEATPQATTQTELTALQQPSPTTTSPAPTPSPAQSGSPSSTQLNVPQGTPKHAIHLHRPHHLQIDAGSDGDQGPSPLGQTSPAGTASTAQQAYSSWQQDLQQVALNSDLLTAQSADWQPVSVSV